MLLVGKCGDFSEILLASAGWKGADNENTSQNVEAMEMTMTNFAIAPFRCIYNSSAISRKGATNESGSTD